VPIQIVSGLLLRRLVPPPQRCAGLKPHKLPSKDRVEQEKREQHDLAAHDLIERRLLAGIEEDEGPQREEKDDPQYFSQDTGHSKAPCSTTRRRPAPRSPAAFLRAIAP
jgi:hypothetical protein